MGTGRGGWTKDRTWAVAAAAGAVVASAVLFRLVQLHRLQEEWDVAHPQAWARQNPEEALRLDGVPPVPGTWTMYLLAWGLATLLTVLVAVAVFAWRSGNDAPTFDDQDDAEQQRRTAAGSVLADGLGNTPKVADTLATRAGRRGAKRRPS